MIKACPNLQVLNLISSGSEKVHRLLKEIIMRCKKLEIFTFRLGHCEEPVSINRLGSEMSKSLVHLKQLYLPDCYLSDNNVRLLTKNIPNLRMVRVHDHMFVSAKVSQFEFNKLIKGSDYFSNFFDPKKPGVVKTEIY